MLVFADGLLLLLSDVELLNFQPNTFLTVCIPLHVPTFSLLGMASPVYTPLQHQDSVRILALARARSLP